MIEVDSFPCVGIRARHHCSFYFFIFSHTYFPLILTVNFLSASFSQVPRSPHSSDDGVDISDVMERDDSSHSYDVIGQTDISPLARSPGVAPLVIVGSFPTSGG